MSSMQADLGGTSAPVTSRHYRRLARPGGQLLSYQARIEQSDLQISAARHAPEEALALIAEARGQVTRYIDLHPEFRSSLAPLPADGAAPPVVTAMLEAARQAGVGPMAAVAGAIAEFVGRRLAADGEDIIVENGGDVFLRSCQPREVAVFAENTAIGGVRFVMPAAPDGSGLATSAGTLGPSLSFGRADAACVLAPTAALADALATAIGNMVRTADDIARAIETARHRGATGAVIIADGHLGAWGALRLAA